MNDVSPFDTKKQRDISVLKAYIEERFRSAEVGNCYVSLVAMSPFTYVMAEKAGIAGLDFGCAYCLTADVLLDNTVPDGEIRLKDIWDNDAGEPARIPEEKQ